MALGRFTLVFLLALGALGWSGAASALPISGPGLDAGGACPESGAACTPAGEDFDVTPAAATGDISFTFNGGSSWTIDIDVAVASLTMPATGGAIDGVDTIVFTDLSFELTGFSALDFGFGTIDGLGQQLGTVSGTYEQFLGATSVVGPTPFSFVDSVAFGTLTCDDSLAGQCGFTVGLDPDELVLDVGTTGSGQPYEFLMTFNTVVPEPSTALLLGLGLAGLGALGRRRG
jgi:hypothetical protein